MTFCSAGSATPTRRSSDSWVSRAGSWRPRALGTVVSVVTKGTPFSRRRPDLSLGVPCVSMSLCTPTTPLWRSSIPARQRPAALRGHRDARRQPSSGQPQRHALDPGRDRHQPSAGTPDRRWGPTSHRSRSRGSSPVRPAGPDHTARGGVEALLHESAAPATSTGTSWVRPAATRETTRGSGCTMVPSIGSARQRDHGDIATWAHSVDSPSAEIDGLIEPNPECGRFTINPYRGCDIRCVYCITGSQGRSVPRASAEATRAALRQTFAASRPDDAFVLGGHSDAYPSVDATEQPRGSSWRSSYCRVASTR